jgi:hypothetical protein
MNTLTKNKKFWEKSKEKQRVAIAKDVLEQIKLGFLHPLRDTYLRLNFSSNISNTMYNPPEKLDELFGKLSQTSSRCDACGIGACFIGLVNLGDKVYTDEVFEQRSVSDRAKIEDVVMRKKLRKIFSREQLSLIECAFERSAYFTDRTRVSVKKRRAAEKYGQQFGNASESLEAIMKNIVKNEGTFVPELHYTVKGELDKRYTC